MRNFLSIDEKSSVREFIINDLIHVGLRIDPTKHRHILSLYQPSPHLSTHSKQQSQNNSRVFNVALHQMDTISIRLDEFDLTVPIFLRWCFDQIRRSIKHEGLFRKSGGSQRIKELMARIDDGSLAPSLSSSNTVFDVCSLFKEFLRRLTYPLITHPLQDLLLDCFSMRQLSSEKKIEMYSNILLLLPDEHLHSLIYILRFLHEITLHERENKMNAKNLAICVGPGLMRATIDGKGSLMTEQCATNVSDIVEALILHASQLGYVTDSIYDRSQMLLEMRQKEVLQCPDESFAMENGGKNGLVNGKFVDPSNSKKRRSGSVKEFLVHMTNRFRRRSGSNNDSRDHTNAFLDQTGKLSSSHTREHRYNYQYYQQNSISEQCLSPQSTSTHTTTTTTKRKSSDDPNGSSSKRGKTKTSLQEKSALPNANRFTSPLTAFRRKKKTSCHTNDPGFPFKIEHSHLPQMLHFTDEVPLRFSNNLVNPSSLSTSSSSLATKGAAGSLATSVIGHGDAHQTSLIIPSDSNNMHSLNPSNNANNKSLDAKKLNLLDSWKWPKSSRVRHRRNKAERKPLLAIHAPMLVPSAIDSSSLGELCPSPIKSTDESIQTLTQQIGSSSLLMHSSFGVHRHHSEEIGSNSFSTTATTVRPRRSISSSSGQAHTRHIICPMATTTHPTEENLNVTQEDQGKDSFDDEDELNLAVVVGNEDAQSLRAEANEGINQENGSLDVAFIDEADLERLVNQREQNSDVAAVEQSQSPMNTTEPLDSNADAHQTSAMMVSILMEKSINKDEDLDDILRRNANRAIRLTDSDDEDNENLPPMSTNRTTPNKESQMPTNTPKIPVRLCSSISSLLASDSISDLPSNKSIDKERLLSSSLSHTLHDVLPFSSEHDENTSILNGGRKSILVLKDTLAGRVSRQVRAIEQRSIEQISNRSIAPSISNETIRSIHPDDRIQASFLPSMINTPEQRLIEDALTRGKKFLYTSIGTGENSRSVKRLQNTPRRRWKERVQQSEEDRRPINHSPSSPFRFLNKTKKKKNI